MESERGGCEDYCHPYATDIKVPTKQMIRSMQATRIQYKKPLHFNFNSVCSEAQLDPWKRSNCSPTLCSRSEPCKSFAEMILSHLRVRCLSAAPVNGTVTQPGVPNVFPTWSLLRVSAGLRLHLEVGAEVSGLGISHREIGVPHTG